MLPGVGAGGIVPGARPGAPAAAAPPGPPREIQVPAELVGGLIGPGGSVINELRAKAGSQVHISVLPAATPGGPQVARISGPEPLLQQAEQLVSGKLDELKERNAARQPKPLPPPPQMGAPAFGNMGLRPGNMVPPNQNLPPAPP